MGTTDGNGVYYPDVGETGWGDEVNNDLTLLSSAITAIAAHEAAAADAHDASAVSFTPGGTVAGTDVQTAVLEVATDAAAAQAAHGTESSAHDAANVLFTPTGTIAGTDVQAAVAEVASEAGAALSTHDADTTAVHGIANTAALETTTGSQAKVDTHLNDTSDAHDASAVSFVPTGTVAATDVQAAIAEVAAEAGGGGAPTTADYLVGTAQGGLSAEIVVGATPNGELGGTWGAITVDASHGGGTHAATQAAAEGTAASALGTHGTTGHTETSAQYAFTGDISPAAISAAQDNYDPTGLSTASTLRLSTNNTTQRNITGLAGGADGRVLFIHNVGTGPIAFIDEGTGSNAANRFAMSGDMILLPDSSMWLQYDATSSRWRAFPRATAATNPAITFGASNLGGTSPYFVRSDDRLIDPTIAHVALMNPHPGYLKGDVNISLTGSITPAAIAAAQDDYNPTGLSTANTLRLATNNTTQRNITGLTAMADGRFLLIHNIGPGPIAFIDESGSSTAANRFAMAGDMILLPDSSMIVQYDGTSSRWRVFPRATAATNPAITFGTTNAGGTSPYFVRSDDQLIDPTIAHAAAADPHTGYVQESLIDAKGDLIVGSAADTVVRVAVGTDYHDTLISDSGQTAGMKWGMARNPLRPTGALFETFPRQAATAANLGALTTQTVRLQAIALPAGLTITSISFVSGTTALSAGVHQIFGLYSSSLALLRSTSDDTNVAWAADSIKTLNLTSQYVTTVSGLYYVAILVQATVPTLVGIANAKSGHMGSPVLTGQSTTGRTTLPDPADAPTVSANHPYAYVS